jgi:prepilin-type N-terminal cleavage/methylation domain-containing protein
MLNKKAKRSVKQNFETNKEAGFTLLEVIIAIFILTVGLMGTVGALTYALVLGTTSRNVGKAKMIIVSTLEEVESLRNTRRLEYKQIANAGSVNNTDVNNPFNGFSVGFKPVSLNPGPDGVTGTDDDLRDPGPDGNFGTGDDFDNPSLIRSGYLRQITIAPLTTDASMKKIEVKVKYFSSTGKENEITGVSYINDEARTTN